jgi:hypothetical protein
MIASGPRFGLRVALPPQAALQNAILFAKKRQLPINRMTHKAVSILRAQRVLRIPALNRAEDHFLV